MGIPQNINHVDPADILNGKTYHVHRDDIEEIYNEIDATGVALDTKVDKVDGKELSTNDYTDADKQLVADVQTDVDNHIGVPAATGVTDGHVDNSKPLQLPELTYAEILAWPTPTVGLTVVDTTNDDVLAWDGTEWKSVFGGGESIVDDYGNILSGTNNDVVNGTTNILVGTGQEVHNSTTNLLVGSDNEAAYNSSRNIMNGYSNYCAYYASNNTLTGRANRAEYSYYCNMTGAYNNITGYGEGSAIVGSSINGSSVDKSMIIGKYHNINTLRNSLLVGQMGIEPGYYNSITVAGGDYSGNVHQNSQLTVGQFASGTGYTSLPINGAGVPSGASRLFKITTYVATRDPSPGDVDFVYEHFITLYNNGSGTQIMGTTSNVITEPTPGIVNFLFGLSGNALTMSVSSSWAPFHVGTKLDILTINNDQ